MAMNLLPLVRAGRLNGLNDLVQLGRDMDRLFEHVIGRENKTELIAADWAAPLAVWEDEGNYHLEIELPGVSTENLELVAQDGKLRIAAERKPPAEERKYWYNERSYGKLERILSLPEGVDEENVRAELVAGVLRVTLRKKPEVLPKKINIKVS